ncbi:hypothetical protein HDE_06048 [Halotydeus destructor]|nr:hypothetical protein HDE_06048 [Halotydeus destructor]
MLYSSAFSLLVLCYITKSTGLPLTSDEFKMASKQNSDLVRKMATEGSCRVPRPRIVYIEDIMRTRTKEYYPKAIILHVCDKQSGCCQDPNASCQVKIEEKVNIWMRTIEMTNGNRKSSFEKLSFFNHTECQCQVQGLGIYRISDDDK